MIIQLVNISFYFVIVLVFIYFSRKSFVQYIRVNKYKMYLDLLQHFLEEAYDIIYKDQIFPYSLEGVTVSGDELETAKRNFIKLTFQLMGSNTINDLKSFFGNRKTLITNMLTYFQSRIDNDEVLQIIKTDQESSK